MSFRNKLFFSLTLSIVFTGLNVSTIHSQSSTTPGTVVSWGSHVISSEENADFISIATGNNHNLALKSDGTVTAWGNGRNGQTTVPSGLDDVIAVAGGGRHSLALREDGTVIAWGADDYGQSTVPSNLDDVIAVAGGEDHSIALRGDGTVIAWGRNRSDQSTVPTGLDDVIAVDAGFEHNLALRSDGTVVAWGSNYMGESTIPEDLDNVVAVSGGMNYSLALRSDGTVLVWGDDVEGVGTVPPGLDDVVAVASGVLHNIALRENGTLVAWGTEYDDVTTIPSNLDNVVAVAAGSSHNLVLREDGTVEAWGSYSSGQNTVPLDLYNVIEIDAGGMSNGIALREDGTVTALRGDGSGQSTVPAGLEDVIAVSVGNSHSLALREDGTVTAWGQDNIGQSTVPTGLDNVVAVAAGGSHSLALQSDGTVIAWGRNDIGQSTIPPGLENVIAIDAGFEHSLALCSDGTVVAWGSDWTGQSTVPPDLDDVVAISAGGAHSLALQGNGSVIAWGEDGDGQSTIPSDLQDVVEVSAGSTHSIALQEDGTVVAWGEDIYGQSTVPPGLNNVISISASWTHNLAIVARNDETDAPSPIPNRKINFLVHSPDYEFDTLEWSFLIYNGVNSIKFSEQDGYWGMHLSEISTICDLNTKISTDILTLKKNGERVGAIRADLCSILDTSQNFKAILFVNDTIEIPASPGWLYYLPEDEVMVSMLVPPNNFQLDDPVASGNEPILAVHGVSGKYPYWGKNIIDEINEENNYHLWQFYYPYDQPIYDSGILLGEALDYLLGDQLFGLPLTYQSNDLKVLAHSMGGLVSRSHIQSNLYGDTIQKLVMLGTPNHGTYAAYRLSHSISGAGGGWFTGKDPFAPAYKQMIPGSEFLRNLNQWTPNSLNGGEDYSYVTVAGIGARNSRKIAHVEIKDQDDEAVAVSNANLLQYDIPLIITDHFHSMTDDPDDAGGFTNAASIAIPLLNGDYNTLFNHSKYMGNVGFNELPDFVNSEVSSNLGSVILDVNFSSFDYGNIIPRSSYRNNNEIRIFSTKNSPLRALSSDKIKGGIYNSLSASFIVNTKLFLDDLGMNFDEKDQVIQAGRYTGNLVRPWIQIGDPVNLEFKSLQANYSNLMELTSAQKLMMQIRANGVPLKRNDQSKSRQYVDSKVDTTLIYVELAGESIDVPDYQIALKSPSGVEHSVNNTPANWDVTEDKEQGYAYFFIPEPESGNWEVDYNPSINNVYVASSIISDIEINSRVRGDNHRVDESVTIEIEIEGGNQLNSYEIDTEYICYNDNSEELEAGSLELQNTEVGVYEVQLLAPSGSVNCTVEPELTAVVEDDEITRTAFSSIDLKASNPTSIDRDEQPDEIPNQSKLHQNYPNPFNPTTNIRFELSEPSIVTLEVYNILGQRVAQLVNERKSPGRYEVNFDASGLSSGVYLYRLQTDSFMETRQMMLIK